MRTRFMTTLILVTCLLVSGQALAQPGTQDCPDEQPVTEGPAQPRIPEDCHRGQPIVRTNVLRTNVLSGGGTTHTVDCPSETIAGVMSEAQPGDTIMITGTCSENVVVDKDGITLDGGGSAVIDGSTADAAAIAVIGHQNVTIRGLTVQNGLHGVRLAGGAAAVLEGTVVATGNARHGVLVEQNSHASVRGMLEANSNGADGILLNNGASAQFDEGAVIEATGNGVTWFNVNKRQFSRVWPPRRLARALQGPSTTTGLTGFWFGSTLPFPLPRGTLGIVGNITATNNGGWGILVDAVSAAFFGTPTSETPSRLILSGNSFDGAGVGSNSSFILRMPAEIRGNTGDGIEAWASSSVDIGTVTGTHTMITGNGGHGIAAWSGATVFLHNATVTDNTGADVGAGGSHLGDGGGNHIGTVHCFGAVWSYGDLSCPEPEQPDQSAQ